VKSAPQAAGQRWARDVAARWRARGVLTAEAYHVGWELARGERDRGDIGGVPGTVIEVKNLSDDRVAAGLNQALLARARQAADWAWYFKKYRGRGTGRGLAVCEVDQAITLHLLLAELERMVGPARYRLALEAVSETVNLKAG